MRNFISRFTAFWNDIANLPGALALNGLVDAIRNALEKAGEPDAHMRARIYQSARNALENGLRKQEINDEAVIAQQRQRLERLIADIERDEKLKQVERTARAEKAAREAAQADPMDSAHELSMGNDGTENAGDPPQETIDPVPGDASLDVTPSHENVHGDDPDAMIGGVADHAPRSAAVAEVQLHDTETGRLGERPMAAPTQMDLAPVGRARPPKKRKRWRARAFSLVLLLCFAGASYWWLDSSGLLIPASERDTSVPNPPPTVEEEDYVGNGAPKTLGDEGGFGRNWFTIFVPSNLTGVAADPDALAELRDVRGEQVLAISAPVGGTQNKVRFAIPSDVLAKLKGNAVTLAITVRGKEADTQIALECDFGANLGCGRHRFAPADRKTDFLFNMVIPAEAGDTGSLVLNTAAGGKDGEAYIYSIHIEAAAGAE